MKSDIKLSLFSLLSSMIKFYFFCKNSWPADIFTCHWKWIDYIKFLPKIIKMPKIIKSKQWQNNFRSLLLKDSVKTQLKDWVSHTYNCMVRLDKILSIYVMRCSIWYQLHNLKTVKITHGGVLLLVKIKAETCNCIKSYAPPWVFSRFLNCTNGNKLRKVSHLILKEIRIFMQYWCDLRFLDTRAKFRENEKRRSWENL